MLIQILVLVGSLAALVAGAELLVRGSVSIATRMGVSSFFIGLTIVGFGTSTPELATSIAAAVRGNSDVSLGNVVGSNIFNIAVILGVGALIRPTPVRTRLVRDEVLIVIAVAGLAWLFAYTGGVVSRGEGVVMLLGLLAYLAGGYVKGRKQANADLAEEVARVASAPAQPESAPPRSLRTPVALVFIVVGLGVLTVGSRFLVDSASALAAAAGVSQLVIGLTIVAAGTSAPELFTSVVAASRGQSDIAVGNILGSNVFNLLGILSIASVIAPTQVTMQTLALDAPLMLALSVALLPILFTGSRISRGEGGVLLAVYGVYLAILLAFAPSWFGTDADAVPADSAPIVPPASLLP